MRKNGHIKRILTLLFSFILLNTFAVNVFADVQLEPGEAVVGTLNLPGTPSFPGWGAVTGATKQSSSSATTGIPTNAKRIYYKGGGNVTIYLLANNVVQATRSGSGEGYIDLSLYTGVDQVRLTAIRTTCVYYSTINDEEVFNSGKSSDYYGAFTTAVFLGKLNPLFNGSLPPHLFLSAYSVFVRQAIISIRL